MMPLSTLSTDTHVLARYLAFDVVFGLRGGGAGVVGGVPMTDEWSEWVQPTDHKRAVLVGFRVEEMTDPEIATLVLQHYGEAATWEADREVGTITVILP